MLNAVFINDSELDEYLIDTTIAERTRALLQHQKNRWDLAKNGYSYLESVQVRKFEFDGFEIKVQFNPGRIVSSSAKVDKKSINERPCFLCYKNLPEHQKGIPYFRDYLILVNPFPIFPEHFTIPKIDHIPQYIENNFNGMLRLSKDIGKYYTVFYNGPKCGASAPDHMHFQAGIKGFMPIEAEYNNATSNLREKIVVDEDLTIYGFKNYLRYFFSLESTDIKKLLPAFEKIYNIFGDVDKNDEPMMNIVCNYTDNRWRVLVFPRNKHRPLQYFEENKNKILLSPAAVDFGGVCITPREEDFDKITKDLLVNIFRQVSISKELYEYYKVHIKKAFENY